MKRLFTILLCLLTIGAAAQRPLKNYTANEFQLAIIDSLGLPKDTFPVPAALKQLPWLGTKADTAYIWSVDAQKWVKLTGALQNLAGVTALGNATRTDILRKSSNGTIAGNLVEITEASTSSGQVNVKSTATGAQTNISPDAVQTGYVQFRNGTSGSSFLSFPYSGTYGHYLPEKSGVLATLGDSITLSNRIDLKLGFGDSALMLAGYQRALGFTPFNASGGTLTGVGGTGFLGLPAQSAAPSAPASGIRLYSSAPGAFAWKTALGLQRELRVRNQTADLIFWFQDKDYTAADSADVAANTAGIAANTAAIATNTASITTLQNARYTKTVFYANCFNAVVGANSVVNYVPLAGMFTTATGVMSSNETVRTVITPAGGYLRNLYLRTNSVPTGGTYVFTVRVNGTDTGLTITVADGTAAGTFSNTSNSVSVSAGDVISLKAVNSSPAQVLNLYYVSLELTNN